MANTIYLWKLWYVN